ncbi:MAG: phenylalanine--tRNA ligase subunit beta [bacterium]|nr:phenylalanine--tRNA ligase subunit beta [bacterium]
MKFSYQWLQSYFKDKLPPPLKLAELLSDHFANVEEVEKSGRDFVLDIEVRPNRGADCFCHWGIAREMAAILKTKWQPHPFKISEDKQSKTADFVRLKIENPKDCRRYTARIINHIRVGPSPVWLKEKLKACGLQSINNVVDIANYLMLASGQPLHAFDFEKIAGQKTPKTIFIRRARAGEKITTLDRKEYQLDSQTLVIADSEKPIGVAGIKGELTTGVDQKTKIILLEAANFNSKTIRKGSKNLSLKTDASWRFEHGVDPNLTEVAVDRAAFLIQKLAQGRIARGRVDFYPARGRAKVSRKIVLDFKMVESLLGGKINGGEIIKILTSLGLGCQKTSKERISATIPTWRPDLVLAEDLVEEIGRILGYHNIPDELPRVILSLPPAENRNIFWEEKTRDIFVEAGFSEVWNYSFLSKTAQGAFGLIKEELLELENPLDQNRPYLVPSLLPNLFLNVVLNSKNFDVIKIFELGKVFLRSPNSSPVEERRISAAVWGRGQADFTELKGGLDFFCQEVGITLVYEKGRGESIFEPQGFFQVKVGREIVGHLGQVKEEIRESLKIPSFTGNFSPEGERISSPLYALEINFEKLFPEFSDQKIYHPLSKHPAAKRDLTLLVSEKTGTRNVLSLIQSLKISLLKKLELVSVYQGEELPAGKKSLSFRLTFQSAERTLSAKEVEDILVKIIERCQSRDWSVRRQ